MAPRDNANEDLGGVDERATAVALAGVLTTTADLGANHDGVDIGAVLVLAGGAGDDGDVDAAEGGRKAAGTAGGSSPIPSC